jgi:FkbM family methyltransferase
MLNKTIALVTYPGAFKAFLTWSKFSFASYKINSRLKESNVWPKTIVDIGANVGQFSVAASKFFNQSKIICIEPDPEVSKKLKRNLRGYLNSEVITCAAGDTTGEVKFFRNQNSQVSSILEIGGTRKKLFPKSQVAEEFQVPMFTLDSLFENRNLEGPILLKLDVQGAELMVLNGGEKFLNRVKWIVIEIAFVNLYNGEPSFIELCNKLNLYSFVFKKPINFHTSPRGVEIIEMDALFERSDV